MILEFMIKYIIVKMIIKMPRLIILFRDKFERNHRITINANMGTVYPPGILNVFVWVANFLSLLSFIVATVIPKEMSSDEALDIIANCLNPPRIANKKAKPV